MKCKTKMKGENSMTKEIRCYGCGAIIQTENEKKIGFVPKNALNR